MALVGPFLVASVLLAAAGMAKVVRPDDTARALAVLTRADGRWPGLTGFRWIVRTAALVEVAVGAFAVALPRPLSAGFVALSYLAFSSVVTYARHRGGPLASCGCFGRPDTPPTLLHLVLDLVLVGCATVFALSAPPDGTIAGILAHQPWLGLPLLCGVAIGTWLVYLAMSTLAQLEGARRLVQPRVRTEPAAR